MTRLAHESDFAGAAPVHQARRARGQMSHAAGMAAEGSVAELYARQGYRLRDARWRGRRGEIDLVFDCGDGVVCVEVKKSKCFDRALASLGAAQVRRLFTAAEEYVGAMPRGSLTDIRFDLALVDAQGQVRVMENAFAG
ncbi:MAG: YraN family protein [Pseudomonadota bacterium]